MLEAKDYPMTIPNPPKVNNRHIRPRRIRELYAALATAPDEARTPIIATHFAGPTRQTILRQISMAEMELGLPANDNGGGHD